MSVLAVRLVPVMLSVDFGEGYDGLSTVGYTLKNPDGTTTPAPAAARTTTGVVDLGDGKYGVEWTPSAGWTGFVLWDTDAGSDVNAIDDILVVDPATPISGDLSGLLEDILTELIRVGGTSVVISSPIAMSGRITVEQGADYAAADSRAITFNAPDEGWPDVTTASGIVFRVSEQLEKAATAVNAATVRVELTAAETAALEAHHTEYEVIATISTRIVPLARGDLVILEAVPPPPEEA